MTRRAKRVVLAAVVFLLLLVFSLLSFQHFALCRSQLINGLYSNWREYRLNHGGHYPSNIILVAATRGDFTVTNSESLLALLSCPGAGTRPSLETTNDSQRSDYIYMNWEPYFGTNDPPPDYPLFYDGRLGNHYGLGVNVVVTGRIFWDFRARWLKRFAAQHPQYRLPLPE